MFNNSNLSMVPGDPDHDDPTRAPEWTPNTGRLFQNRSVEVPPAPDCNPYMAPAPRVAAQYQPLMDQLLQDCPYQQPAHQSQQNPPQTLQQQQQLTYSHTSYIATRSPVLQRHLSSQLHPQQQQQQQQQYQQQQQHHHHQQQQQQQMYQPQQQPIQAHPSTYQHASPPLSFGIPGCPINLPSSLIYPQQQASQLQQNYSNHHVSSIRFGDHSGQAQINASVPNYSVSQTNPAVHLPSQSVSQAARSQNPAYVARNTNPSDDRIPLAVGRARILQNPAQRSQRPINPSVVAQRSLANLQQATQNRPARLATIDAIGNNLLKNKQIQQQHQTQRQSTNSSAQQSPTGATMTILQPRTVPQMTQQTQAIVTPTQQSRYTQQSLVSTNAPRQIPPEIHATQRSAQMTTVTQQSSSGSVTLQQQQQPTTVVTQQRNTHNPTSAPGITTQTDSPPPTPILSDMTPAPIATNVDRTSSNPSGATAVINSEPTRLSNQASVSGDAPPAATATSVTSTTRPSSAASANDAETFVRPETFNKACQVKISNVQMVHKMLMVKPEVVDEECQTDRPAKKTYVDRASSPIIFPKVFTKSVPKRRKRADSEHDSFDPDREPDAEIDVC